MAHGHQRVLCKECDTVITQCRCMSRDKITEYSTCDKCKIAIAEGAITMLPDIKQQLRESLAREAYLKGQLKQLQQQLRETK